jgi:ABC-type nickel/cobalt efflux system permease component RcnA
LLVGAVVAIGVLHTIVPDHWAPIALIARQQGWTRGEVARAALVAGSGHTVSTLLIGLIVWVAGVAFATRFGNLVSTVSSLALIAFGGWIAVSSLRELRTGARHGHGHAHDHDDDHARGLFAHGDHLHSIDDALYAPSRGGTAVLATHVHAHRHGGSIMHVHLHDHVPDTWHPEVAPHSSDPPLHNHKHRRSFRTTLLLVLGSSPMVEGIPVFFAAAKYGAALIAMMALAFAISTIATYVLLCVSSVAGLQRVSLGPLERYGEVMSGAFVAIIGLVFLVFPAI